MRDEQQAAVRRCWLDRGTRLGLSFVLLYCAYLVATHALAVWYARRQTPEALRTAIRWDPGNPEYYAALARLLEGLPEGPSIAEVLGLHEQAARLSPHRASYWSELGGAYEWAGRLDDARRAYEQAARLFPNSPEINWQLGNFHLREGRTREALRAFRKSLLGDPRKRRPAFELAWRDGADAPLILSEMIPGQADILFEYLSYLVASERLDAAEQAWARLLRLRMSFDVRQAFPYLDALIERRRASSLTAAWRALAARNPGRIPLPSSPVDLITNGGFESEILNGGLDWRVNPVKGAVVQVDRAIFFDGTRSLAIHFDGTRNLDYADVYQYVPVEPQTWYKFSAYLRAEGITTESGPRFQIYDPGGSSRLFLSADGVVGSSGWLQQQFKFRTGHETRLLIVRLRRQPSWKLDNQIAGTVWIDHVSLTAIP